MPDGAEGDRLDDIVWLHPDGAPMETATGRVKPRRSGCTSTARASTGSPLGAGGSSTITSCSTSMPTAQGSHAAPGEYAASWDVVIDTGGDAESDRTYDAGARLPLSERSVLVLREHSQPEAEPDHSVAASVAAHAQGDDAHPCEHLPAPDQPRSRLVRGRRTAAVPARPGSRLGLPVAVARRRAGQRPRLRRRRTRPRGPESRGGATAWPAIRRGAPAGNGRARRHRAQPRRGGDARGERMVVGPPAPAGRRVARTPPPSTSTGTPAAAGPHPGAR